MPKIHPTAVIERGATLADDVIIGPFCHVARHVTIGSATRLISHVTVLGHTTLGQGNVIWPQAVLGGDPQDLKFRGEPTTLTIGDHNEIREAVTIHRGTGHGGGHTQLGSDNLLMAGVHVAHDCQLGNRIVIANSTQLAGHVRVQDHVSMAGMTGVHHFVTIGRYAYVGGMSRIVRDVPPYMIVEGQPARVRGVNVIGLERHRFDTDSIARLKHACRALFRGPLGDFDPDRVRHVEATLEQLAREHPGDAHLNYLAAFLRESAKARFSRHQESLRTDNRHTNPTR